MDSGKQDVSLPGRRSAHTSLDGLGRTDLEQILVDLLIVRYPGIEEEDILRLFAALDHGGVGEVEQVEADMAQKSAQWQQAAQDLMQ
jgi:hypothetical protein